MFIEFESVKLKLLKHCKKKGFEVTNKNVFNNIL